jgi:hypothetical protein
MKSRFCFPWQTPQNVALGVSHFSLKVFHSGRTPSDDPSVSDARHTCRSECENDSKIDIVNCVNFTLDFSQHSFKRLVSYFPTCPWGDGQARPVSHWPPHLNSLRNRVKYLAFIYRLLAPKCFRNKSSSVFFTISLSYKTLVRVPHSIAFRVVPLDLTIMAEHEGGSGLKLYMHQGSQPARAVTIFCR